MMRQIYTKEVLYKKNKNKLDIMKQGIATAHLLP